MSQATEEKKQESSHGPLAWPELLGRWIVVLVSIPVQFASSLLSQFLSSNGAGTPILGFVALAIGTIISADSIWQGLFQGPPLFLMYEDTWIGWSGWATLLFNFLFWISVVISYMIIRVEAWTLRGVSPDKAKKDYLESAKYELPEQPTKGIDLTKMLWKRYKRAGTAKYRNAGLIALFFVSGDVVMTFASRWPWRYENPSDIIFCFLFNCFVLIAGEIGFEINRTLRLEATRAKDSNYQNYKNGKK